MTFNSTTSPNLHGYRYPYGNKDHRGSLPSLNSSYEPAKSVASPFVDYFIPDRFWGSDIFTNINEVEQSTVEQSYSLDHALPGVSDSIPSIVSSIIDSANNCGSRSIPWLLGSLFQIAPGTLSSTLPVTGEFIHGLPRSSPKNGGLESGRTDNGKGKARAADPGIEKYVPEPPQMGDEAFVDTLREAMAASRRAGSRIRSPEEAGPSGSSSSTLASDITSTSTTSASFPHTHHFISEAERAEISHAILLSSIERVENALHDLQTNFTFPTHLDYHLPSNFSHLNPVDEENAGSIATYLPTTSRNSIVFNFVRELRGLLRQLDHLDSKKDPEAESMKKKVVAALNEALDDVESRIEEGVGKWMSLQAVEVDVVGS